MKILLDRNKYTRDFIFNCLFLCSSIRSLKIVSFLYIEIEMTTVGMGNVDILGLKITFSLIKSN
jgi:hypothetical protein